jgi:hypothetical protein
MKKSWIFAGLGIVAVVAVGIIVFTTKNANDTKNGDDSATGGRGQVSRIKIDWRILGTI